MSFTSTFYLKNISPTRLQKHPLFKILTALTKRIKREKLSLCKEKRAYQCKYYWFKQALIQNKFTG